VHCRRRAKVLESGIDAAQLLISQRKKEIERFALDENRQVLPVVWDVFFQARLSEFQNRGAL
jgi:hypothetical protein